MRRDSGLKDLKKSSEISAVKITDLSDEYIGQKLTLGGVVTKVKKVFTKRTNAEMAFITISDGISEIDAVVFPATFESSKGFLIKDAVVVMSGRIDKREEELSFVIEKIDLFDSENLDDFAKIQSAIEIYIPQGTDVAVLQSINRTLRGYPGSSPVVILLPGNGSELKRLSLPFTIEASVVLEREIKQILGEGSFKKV